MKRRITSFLVLALLAGTALVVVDACDAPTSPPYDRAALLRETGEQVIVPGYEAVHTDATTLAARAHALCDAPSLTTLADARDAWRATFLDWRRTGAYQFGPARDMNLGPEMAFSPTRPPTIEANIAGTAEITDAWVDTLGAGGKGLYAIEYLLFAPEDNAAVLTALSDPRRCAYVAALADHVERTSGRIVTAWRPDGGDYVGTLATAGEPGNEAYLAQLSAVSTLMTQLLSQVTLIKINKLGIPLGVADGAPQPGSVEAPYAHASVEAMLADLEGAHRVWSTTEHSLDGYLRSRQPELADRILAELDAARVAIGALPEPFAEYVAGPDHAAGDATYERLRELERSIATDASTVLAVSVMFTDNDGD